MRGCCPRVDAASVRPLPAGYRCRIAAACCSCATVARQRCCRSQPSIHAQPLSTIAAYARPPLSLCSNAADAMFVP
ncbi:hypothetical protein BHE74_00037549 [Ensete ventricosum]|nr:hypothetical protein BHE74_00037549 [Ensete ventricosum]